MHHVEAHQDGKGHSDEHRKQAQEVILDSDHLVIQAEDVLFDPALRRVMRMAYRSGHLVSSGNWICDAQSLEAAAEIIFGPVESSTFRNRPGSTPSWWSASGNGRDRTAPNKVSRKPPAYRPGTPSGFPCPGRYPASGAARGRRSYGSRPWNASGA